MTIDHPPEAPSSQISTENRPIIANDPYGRLWNLRILSQNVRNIQLKLHLLCEDYELASGGDANRTSSRSTTMDRYEAIGTDLRSALHEWERVKLSLLDGRESGHQSRSALRRLSISLSPTSSLGGSTLAEGSPQDALRALAGTQRSTPRSSRASSGSEEQVFEAVAESRPKSILTRDERIAKMKEERNKQLRGNERTRANTNMLRELETVIKLRPRGRTTTRVTSL